MGKSKQAEQESDSLFFVDKDGSKGSEKQKHKKSRDAPESENSKENGEAQDERTGKSKKKNKENRAEPDHDDVEEEKPREKKKSSKKFSGADEGGAEKEGTNNDEEVDDGKEKKKTKNTGTKRGSEAGRLDEATLPYVKEVTALAKADEFEADEDRYTPC